MGKWGWGCGDLSLISCWCWLLIHASSLLCAVAQCMSHSMQCVFCLVRFQFSQLQTHFFKLHCQFSKVSITGNYNHLPEVITNIFGTEVDKGPIEGNSCGLLGGTKTAKGFKNVMHLINFILLWTHGYILFHMQKYALEYITSFLLWNFKT